MCTDVLQWIITRQSFNPSSPYQGDTEVPDRSYDLIPSLDTTYN